MKGVGGSIGKFSLKYHNFGDAPLPQFVETGVQSPHSNTELHRSGLGSDFSTTMVKYFGLSRTANRSCVYDFASVEEFYRAAMQEALNSPVLELSCFVGCCRFMQHNKIPIIAVGTSECLCNQNVVFFSTAECKPPAYPATS